MLCLLSTAVFKSPRLYTILFGACYALWFCVCCFGPLCSCVSYPPPLLDTRGSAGALPRLCRGSVYARSASGCFRFRFKRKRFGDCFRVIDFGDGRTGERAITI